MRTVTIEQLRADLDEHVGLAAAGEIILVRGHDGVVVRLVPETRSAAPEEPAEAVIADLVARGVATAASAPRGTVPPRFELASFEQLMRDLDEDRADRW